MTQVQTVRKLEEVLDALLLFQEQVEKKIQAYVSALLIVGSSIVSSTSSHPAVNYRRTDLAIMAIRMILIAIAQLHDEIEDQYLQCRLPEWAPLASDYEELWEEFQELLSDAALYLEAYQVLLCRRVRGIYEKGALMRERYEQRCTIKSQLVVIGEAMSEVYQNCSQWREDVRVAAQEGE
jgi:hypothetical protein